MVIEPSITRSYVNLPSLCQNNECNINPNHLDVALNYCQLFQGRTTCMKEHWELTYTRAPSMHRLLVIHIGSIGPCWSCVALPTHIQYWLWGKWAQFHFHAVNYYLQFTWKWSKKFEYWWTYYGWSMVTSPTLAWNDYLHHNITIFYGNEIIL